eukprot:357291-Chlamydomonas_euryale.AAC.3
MQWLRQAAAGRQVDTEVAECYGRPPDLEEVHACIKALRSHATSGGDQMEVTFLKAGLLIARWLLKVICFAWDSGIAPAEWKSAVIAPLYKGKGPRDAAGSYQGISLLKTIREQCGMSSLELMVRRRTLQWMGHILRIDESRLPRQVFNCSSAKSAAEDGRVEQLKSRPGHTNIKAFSGMYSSAIQGCHEESSDGGTIFQDFLKLHGYTELIPWPEIGAAAVERALDKQAWRDAVENFAPL